MTTSDPALASLAEAITATVATGDVDRMAEFLRGRRLPAVGGNLTPAEILARALEQIPDPEILRRLSRLIGRLINELIEPSDEPTLLDAQRRAALANAVWLASDLPATAELFGALRVLLDHYKGKLPEVAADTSPFELQVHQALVYQQVDRSHEDEWLSILWGSDRDEPPWTPSRRTLLLTAWRGLLWIPPEMKFLAAGEVIDFQRIEQGLLALHAAVVEHTEGSELLQVAFSILTDTFPRSFKFWVEFFRPSVEGWPARLQAAAAARWPDLAAAVVSRGTTESLAVWRGAPQRLKAGQRQSSTWHAVGGRMVLPSEGWDHYSRLFSADTLWKKGLRTRDLARIRYRMGCYLGDLDNWMQSSPEEPGLADLHFSFGSYLSHILVKPISLFCLSGLSATRGDRCDALSVLKILRPNDGSFHRDWLSQNTDFCGNECTRAIEHLSNLSSLDAEAKSVSQSLANCFQLLHYSGHGAAEPPRWLPGPVEPEAFPQDAPEVVLLRHSINALPALEMAVSLDLACYVPQPLGYLTNLSMLAPAERHVALAQVRRLLLRAWNPLERSYLGSILTLTALKEADFNRALHELSTQIRKRVPISIEYKVLELHAHAGAGQRSSCKFLFQRLESDPALQGTARETVQLLDDAFGFSGNASSSPFELHDQIIECEASMLTQVAPFKRVPPPRAGRRGV